MTDTAIPAALAAAAKGRPQIIVPPLCDACARAVIVRDLKIAEDGPWEQALLGIQLMLMQVAFCDSRMTDRAGHTKSDIAARFAEIACLGCFLPDALAKATTVARQGFAHQCAVSQGKVTDPAWPAEWQPAAAKSDSGLTRVV